MQDMGKKVLYVEDNPRNMRLVRKFLEHAGYEVLEAENGLKGLEIAEKERPDVILMDINLPDIDGLEATMRLKDNTDLKAIPVIALTANAMHGDRERCLAGGCDGYIPKPINKTELLDTVSRFVVDVSVQT
jgi:two-component system cell cycle response regulator DivK